MAKTHLTIKLRVDQAQEMQKLLHEKIASLTEQAELIPVEDRKLKNAVLNYFELFAMPKLRLQEVKGQLDRVVHEWQLRNEKV